MVTLSPRLVGLTVALREARRRRRRVTVSQITIIVLICLLTVWFATCQMELLFLLALKKWLNFRRRFRVFLFAAYSWCLLRVSKCVELQQVIVRRERRSICSMVSIVVCVFSVVCGCSVPMTHHYWFPVETNNFAVRTVLHWFVGRRIVQSVVCVGVCVRVSTAM